MPENNCASTPVLITCVRRRKQLDTSMYFSELPGARQPAESSGHSTTAGDIPVPSADDAAAKTSEEQQKAADQTLNRAD
jgi:hypothetical protein